MRKSIFILTGLAIYLAAIIFLHFSFGNNLIDFLIPFVVIGIGFSGIAWFVLRKNTDAVHKPANKKEWLFIVILVLWIGFYITYGGSLFNKLVPSAWIENLRLYSIIIFLRKLLFFVLVPFFIYRVLGFSLKDFGLTQPAVKLFPGKSLLTLIVLSIAAILFQYYASRGSKDFQNNTYGTVQLVLGLPLCLLYLVFDAGLIEEFFFRGLLQARLSALLNSTAGGIVVSAIIFGLVHAPGLYLRGADSEGIEEQMPFMFFAAYTIAYMSVAGIFLGIIYSKTKNLWLVMILHGVLDLLPNFGDFIHTWSIR